MPQAHIGVIGGSGLYRMEGMSDVEEIAVQTPFGDPSDVITVGKVEGVSMALAQRSDFSAWLQQHHGDVAALSKELQLRAQSFREQDATGQTGRTALER